MKKKTCEILFSPSVFMVPFNYCWILPKLGKKGLNYCSHSQMLGLSQADADTGQRGTGQWPTGDKRFKWWYSSNWNFYVTKKGLNFLRKYLVAQHTAAAALLNTNIGIFISLSHQTLRLVTHEPIRGQKDFKSTNQRRDVLIITHIPGASQLDFFAAITLQGRGFVLCWCWFLPDPSPPLHTSPEPGF